MKYKAGDVITPFTVKNFKGETVTIPDPNMQYTHLQFNRWCGDPIGDVHISGFRKASQRIRDLSINEVVFFHSEQADIEKWYPSLRINIIPDANKQYFKMFGVEESSKWLMKKKAFQTFWKGLEGHHFTLKAGKYGMNGLPADFLIAANGKIVACRYGLHGGDFWEVNEMLLLAKTFENYTDIDSNPESAEEQPMIDDVVASV